MIWIVASGCSRAPTFHDANVEAGEVARPLDFLAVHSSRPRYIKVCGKTYYGVRGVQPYYLSLSKGDEILFVTENKKSGVRFHIVDVRKCQAVEIEGRGSGFGGNIGSGRRAGEKYTDYIEEATDTRLTLATRSGDWKEITVLNVREKRIERQETLFLDQLGHVTNRVVAENH